MGDGVARLHRGARSGATVTGEQKSHKMLALSNPMVSDLGTQSKCQRRSRRSWTSWSGCFFRELSILNHPLFESSSASYTEHNDTMDDSCSNPPPPYSATASPPNCSTSTGDERLASLRRKQLVPAYFFSMGSFSLPCNPRNASQRYFRDIHCIEMSTAYWKLQAMLRASVAVAHAGGSSPNLWWSILRVYFVCKNGEIVIEGEETWGLVRTALLTWSEATLTGSHFVVLEWENRSAAEGECGEDLTLQHPMQRRIDRLNSQWADKAQNHGLQQELQTLQLHLQQMQTRVQRTPAASSTPTRTHTDASMQNSRWRAQAARKRTVEGIAAMIQKSQGRAQAARHWIDNAEVNNIIGNTRRAIQSGLRDTGPATHWSTIYYPSVERYSGGST